MMRTIPIGKADSKHYKMHEACLETLNSCKEKLISGNISIPDDVKRESFADD